MTVKEKLCQLVEALPEQEAEQLKAQLESVLTEGSDEWPESFLQTYGGWEDDPRSTEQILREIYESRALSTRGIDL